MRRMTNDEIDTRVRQLVSAFIASQGKPNKAMTATEVNAIQAITELSSNFLQNLNDLARTARGE